MKKILQALCVLSFMVCLPISVWLAPSNLAAALFMFGGLSLVCLPVIEILDESWKQQNQ